LKFDRRAREINLQFKPAVTEIKDNTNNININNFDKGKEKSSRDKFEGGRVNLKSVNRKKMLISKDLEIKLKTLEMSILKI
jgi:hypothetical protein